MDLALNNIQRLMCHKTKPNLLYIIRIYFNVCKQIIDVKWLLLHSNSCNNLTECKQMSNSN